MPYPEPFVAPMRQELTALGARELRTPAEVDAAVTGTNRNRRSDSMDARAAE